MLLSLWLMLGVCSLSVLESSMSYCWCLFSMYGSEAMIWREKGRSRIRAVQMDGLLGIRRMDKVPNTPIRQLCGVTKDVDEKMIKVFSDSSAMCREWRTTGLLRGSM